MVVTVHIPFLRRVKDFNGIDVQSSGPSACEAACWQAGAVAGSRVSA
jgi:hypothetical protein